MTLSDEAFARAATLAFLALGRVPRGASIAEWRFWAYRLDGACTYRGRPVQLLVARCARRRRRRKE